MLSSRKRLNNNKGNVKQQQDGPKEDVAANTLRWCYLQLAQCMPMVIHLAIYAFSNIYPIPIVNSLEDVRAGTRAAKLSIASSVTDVFAHCFHLCTYFACSKMFRKRFLDTFFCK